MFRDRLFAAIPSLCVSIGFALHVIIRERVPASLENAIGPFTLPWLYAIIIACAINGVFAAVPDKITILQAESATRWAEITLMVGFAVASWSGHGRSIQGILAFVFACWSFERAWSLRQQLRTTVKAEQIRAQINEQRGKK